MQVERAKKCLDFAATIYFIHLVAVTCISGFPHTSSWCVLHCSVIKMNDDQMQMQTHMSAIPRLSHWTV